MREMNCSFVRALLDYFALGSEGERCVEHFLPWHLCSVVSLGDTGLGRDDRREGPVVERGETDPGD